MIRITRVCSRGACSTDVRVIRIEHRCGRAETACTGYRSRARGLCDAAIDDRRWSTGDGSDGRSSSNRIIDRAGRIVVVAGDIGECPGIARVGAGIGVGGWRKIETNQCFGGDTGRGAGRSVCRSIIGERVRSDHDGGVSLADRIIDRAGRIVVVAGDIGECPGIARVGAGIGVGGWRKIETNQCFGGDTGRGAGRSVCRSIIGERVRSDHDGGVSLADRKRLCV